MRWNLVGRTYNQYVGKTKSYVLNIEAEAFAETSIEKNLFKVDPHAKAIEDFEKLSWRQQQLILGRLALMEQVVSLKLLPLAMGLFTLVVGGFITWAIKANVDGLIFMWGSLLLAAMQVFLLMRMRTHREQDARLNAWSMVLKASHALRTKAEEEYWKQIPPTTWPQGQTCDAQDEPRPPAAASLQSA